MRGSTFSKRNGQAQLIINLSFRLNLDSCLLRGYLPTLLAKCDNFSKATFQLTPGQMIKTCRAFSWTSRTRRCKECHNPCWAWSFQKVRNGIDQKQWLTNDLPLAILIDSLATRLKTCSLMPQWTLKIALWSNLISNSNFSVNWASILMTTIFKIIKISNGVGKRKGG